MGVFCGELGYTRRYFPGGVFCLGFFLPVSWLGTARSAKGTSEGDLHQHLERQSERI
jgi:hypothetical protein